MTRKLKQLLIMKMETHHLEKKVKASGLNYISKAVRKKGNFFILFKWPFYLVKVFEHS